MERVDVAVVGGGPAGTAAAWAAASAGADAVAVEKGVPRADRDRQGPDSTDAAGMLDYWVDIMGIDHEEIPDDVVLQEFDYAEFVGPSERVVLPKTGIESSYPSTGYTFDRVGMDDWLRDRAERAGATYRVGDGVREVESDLSGEPSHTVVLTDGTEYEATYLILADGPQRTVTGGVLDRFLPDGESVTDHLSTTEANHIAYQEHRRFPPELFEDDRIKFWWGWMPGETAYPWVFPNDDQIARVGLTMPIGLELDDVDRPGAYPLLNPDDDSIPTGAEYVRRLLERLYGDRYDPSEFPRVESRGKRGGTETYPISSTRPIDSPTAANVAVVGGAMGTTSAFHEGGYHVAVRTGREAGSLAAVDSLDRYNEVWKAAVGPEILRNVTFAEMVADYGPEDWDRAFRTAAQMIDDPTAGGTTVSATGAGADRARGDGGRIAGGEGGDGGGLASLSVEAGITGLKLWGGYKRRKWSLRGGDYVQIPESTYVV